MSGEYVMYMVVFEKGWFSKEIVILELLKCIKRLGVDGIFIYFVKFVVELLNL